MPLNNNAIIIFFLELIVKQLIIVYSIYSHISRVAHKLTPVN